MALTIDVASSANGGGTAVSSLTWAHTCGASANLLRVGVSLRNGSSQTVTGITYNGVALTFVGAIANGTTVRSEFWKLAAPTTGSSQNIVVTLSAAALVIAGAESYNGADSVLGAAVTAVGAGTAPSVVASSATGEIVADTLTCSSGAGRTITVGAGQTQRWNLQTGTSGADEISGGSTEAGAASVTMSWTISSSETWAIIAVPIMPLSAGYRDVPTRLRLAIRNIRDVASRVRIRVTRWTDTQARFVLNTGIYRDTVTRLRLRATSWRDSRARFVLSIDRYRSTATRVVVIATAWKDAAQRFRLEVTRHRDANTRARVRATRFADQTTRFVLVRPTTTYATRSESSVTESTERLREYALVVVE